MAPAAYNWLTPYTGNDGVEVTQSVNSILTVRNPGRQIEIMFAYLIGPDGDIVHTYVDPIDPSTWITVQPLGGTSFSASKGYLNPDGDGLARFPPGDILSFYLQWRSKPSDRGKLFATVPPIIGSGIIYLLTEDEGGKVVGIAGGGATVISQQ